MSENSSAIYERIFSKVSKKGIYYLSYLMIAICLIVCFFMTGYWQEFGETDSYRAANGIINAINNQKLLSDSLLYGNESSPLYYRLLMVLAPIANNPSIFSLAMNIFSALFAAGALVAIACIAGEFGGRNVSLGAALAAVTTPLWWKVSQYAHPTWPAIFFFLCAVAFAMKIRGWQRRDQLLYAAVLVCLICSFGSRVDNAAMAPMFLGAMWQDNRLKWGRGIALAAIGVLAIPLAKLLFGVGDVTGQVDQATLLATWFAPSRYLHYASDSLVRFVTASNPVTIMAAGACMLVALVNKQWRLLLLTLPLAFLDFIFWIPDGERERHFLGIIPAIAILIGYGLAETAATIPNGARIFLASTIIPMVMLFAVAVTGSNLVLYLAALPIAISAFLLAAYQFVPGGKRPGIVASFLLLIALAMLFAVRHRPYENQIRTGGDLRAEQLATRVLLSAQSGPLYVISSAPPLAAHLQRRQPMMQMSQTPVIPSPDDPSKSDEWVQLAAATGTISMYDQGWNEPEALAALLQRTQGRHATVLIDSQVAPNLAKMPLGRYNLNKVVM